MLKDFLFKKENIFIFFVAVISIFFVILGFILLFIKDDSDGPRTIPSAVTDISWEIFSSKVLDTKIQYPEYMYIEEQKEIVGTGITIAEFKPQDFLTYFSNQNHVSIYPEGLDNQLFYGKTKESEYTSSSGQTYNRVEYLTRNDEVWAVMLAPKEVPEGWQSKGFIWIQTALKNRGQLCVSSNGIVARGMTCDPYSGQQPLYEGEISGQFIRFGYEIVNKNTF